MNISDINYTIKQLQSLSRRDISKIVSKLASAANKRLKRIELAGLEDYSSAYRYVKSSGGKFSVKGKSKEELLLEYKRVKGYLSPERRTSTLSGTRKVKEENEQKVADRLGVTFKNEKESKDFWRAYNKYADTHRSDVYNQGSDTIQRLIAQRVERSQTLNASAVTKMINKYIEAEREEISRIEREEFTELFDRVSETDNPFV